MAVHRIRRGLDLPIAGEPKPELTDAPAPARVAVLAADYTGLKPRMLVADGDTVRRGQKLLEDRTNPGVFLTAPAAGKVLAVHRGAKRALQSVVIELSDAEKSGGARGGDLGDADHQTFETWEAARAETPSADALRALLLESGLWTAFRARPFSKVPAADAVPAAIFVTAIDTHPLAPPVEKLLEGREQDFERGLRLVKSLSGGETYLCVAKGSRLGGGQSGGQSAGGLRSAGGISVQEFEGRHPAGTPGVHIHLLAPVHHGRSAWHIGAQDVLAIAALHRDGRLDVRRIIALAGPAVREPRLLRTRIGASIDGLVDGQLHEGENRVISGSVLGGRPASGDIDGYLGRYHNQISVLREGRERELFGWLTLGFSAHSVIPHVLSRLTPERRIAFTTAQHGGARPMIPIGLYERVMPFDIMATHLLRALAMDDVERAERLGALELAEEDLALCSYVCPGKTDWGAELRRNLDIIQKEG